MTTTPPEPAPPAPAPPTAVLPVPGRQVAGPGYPAANRGVGYPAANRGVGYPEESRGVLVLVLGLLALLVSNVLGPVAWWLGVSERRAVAAGRRPRSGLGTATAGMVLGIIATAFLAFGVLAAVVVLVVFLVLGMAALPLALVADQAGLGDLDALGEPTAADWEDAQPREGTSTRTGDVDRCDLVSWFEEQLAPGMTTRELREAVGSPDSLEIADGQEVWTWDLGVCWLDYDVYELEIVDGELVGWRYVQG